MAGHTLPLLRALDAGAGDGAPWRISSWKILAGMSGMSVRQHMCSLHSPAAANTKASSSPQDLPGCQRDYWLAPVAFVDNTEQGFIVPRAEYRSKLLNRVFIFPLSKMLCLIQLLFLERSDLHSEQQRLWWCGGCLLGLLLFTKLILEEINEHWLPAARWKSGHRNPGR